MSTFDPYAYLDAAAAALELPIPAQCREGVAGNPVRLYAMARDVIDFPLLYTVENSGSNGGEPS